MERCLLSFKSTSLITPFLFQFSLFFSFLLHHYRPEGFLFAELFLFTMAYQSSDGVIITKGLAGPRLSPQTIVSINHPQATKKSHYKCATGSGRDFLLVGNIQSIIVYLSSICSSVKRIRTLDREETLLQVRRSSLGPRG